MFDDFTLRYQLGLTSCSEAEPMIFRNFEILIVLFYCRKLSKLFTHLNIVKIHHKQAFKTPKMSPITNLEVARRAIVFNNLAQIIKFCINVYHKAQNLFFHSPDFGELFFHWIQILLSCLSRHNRR